MIERFRKSLTNMGISWTNSLKPKFCNFENFRQIERACFLSGHEQVYNIYKIILKDNLPIRAPTTVIRLLFNMKPSAQRAQPEQEFKTVMTTGMSAPPIAMVKVTPDKKGKKSLKKLKAS